MEKKVQDDILLSKIRLHVRIIVYVYLFVCSFTVIKKVYSA